MDKLTFLQRIVQLHPDDAEAHYWLAQEHALRGELIEAIAKFSAGLALNTTESIRLALIAGITQATQSLQQGVSSANRNDQSGEASLVNIQEVDEYYDEEDEDDENYDDANDIEEDAAEAQGQTYVRLTTPTEQPSGSSSQVNAQDGVYGFSSSPIGLQVLSGGKTSEESLPNTSVSNKVTFDDVAGLHELKKTIRLRIISPFQNQSLFSKFRKKAGGGVLLYGPPGCGKTFITKATAGECRATFIPVHITDILSKYIGESEHNLKDLFDKARSQKPSIMFFDEIDTVGFNRSQSSSSMRGMIDTFLTEMEGIDTNTDQVLVIGATNLPWDVDSALKRPGRFDRLVFVGPPDEEAREQMFRLKLSGRYTEEIDVQKLASKTEFFSGADIENVCERAAERVLGEILETGIERPISMFDFEAVLQEVRPSTLEWLRTAKNYVKYANQSGIYNDVEDYLKRYGRRI